jgi:outer membrane protein
MAKVLKRIRRAGGLLVFVLLFAPVAAHAQAQQATLTLEEAIALARRNNPDYLQQANDIINADWAVRDAYGSLLPGASVSTSYGYQAAGTPRFGNFTGSDFGLASTTDYYSSSYSLGLSYRLSGQSLLAPGQAKSQRFATEAGIEAAEFSLRTNVSRQYLAVKRALDGVTLAKQELARAEENLKLAQARVQVGAAIPLEAKQAQVERGRAEVNLLQVENLVETERLRLAQLLGVTFEQPVTLTTEFAIRDVPWTAEQLVAMAVEQNPQLRAARASQAAAQAGVKMARSAYLPSLSLSAGISGFARQAGNTDYLINQARSSAESSARSCQTQNLISSGLTTPLPGFPLDCSRFTVTADDEARIRADNSVFPFDYSKDPFSVSLGVSLPLFDGLNRERMVEQARVARTDAELRVQSEQLRVKTEVATALRNVQTARRAAELERVNAELAAEQLTLARERYRVGAASFIELQEAETVKARADRAFLTAVYQFHENLHALEAAVGRPMAAEIR